MQAETRQADARTGTHPATQPTVQAATQAADRARTPLTLAYAACHFVIDLACIATMLGAVSASLGIGGAGAVLFAILAYDLLAFCLQLPFGALLDLVGRSVRAAMLACLLVASGVALALLPGAPAAWSAVALVALGNALFHCAGGIDVLGVSEGAAAPSGVFISTGAAGVFLGSMAAGAESGFAPVLLALLAGCLVVLALVEGAKRRAWRLPGRRRALPAASWRLAGACLLLAATVALRSYAGMEMAFPWKAELALAGGLVAGVVAGKAAGGLLADRFGLAAISVVSLAGSAALFPFAWSFPLAGMAAAFLLNFTMPITLISLARLMPGSLGLAFGTASFSLAIGALPALVGLHASGTFALSLLAAVSLACLLAGLALAKGLVEEAPRA